MSESAIETGITILFFPEMEAAAPAFRWMGCIPELAAMKSPVIERDGLRLFRGDCLHLLHVLPDASIDACVTDPPAGIGFMGREWDDDKGGREQWIGWLCDVMREVFRVLKPGAHALVWALPKTSHWTATALEDAGFEVREKVFHLFGSGFPKSLNVSKAIDKAAGATREVVGSRVLTGNAALSTADKGGTYGVQVGSAPAKTIDVTAPATEAAKQWSGWGTALKPAVEDWWLVRKPLAENTVAANVQAHGTGAINVDGCRVPGAPRTTHADGNFTGNSSPDAIFPMPNIQTVVPSGRFPANLVLSHGPSCRKVGTRKVVSGTTYEPTGERRGDRVAGAPTPMLGRVVGYADADGTETIDAYDCAEGCPVAEMDRQSIAGGIHGAGGVRDGSSNPKAAIGWYGTRTSDTGEMHRFGDSGGASRFFHRFEWDDESLEAELQIQRFLYVAKPSTAERNLGCDELPEVEWWTDAANHCRDDQTNTSTGKPRVPRTSRNHHPTVKGQHLMRHLVRLITPPRGVVLDPFAGSGSTLIAAHAEGFRAIGIEREADYVEIARKRIEAATKQRNLFAEGA